MWSNAGHSLLILTSPNCSQIRGLIRRTLYGSGRRRPTDDVRTVPGCVRTALVGQEKCTDIEDNQSQTKYSGSPEHSLQRAAADRAWPSPDKDSTIRALFKKAKISWSPYPQLVWYTSDDRGIYAAMLYLCESSTPEGTVCLRHSPCVVSPARKPTGEA